MLIFWITWPHTGRIVTQWRYCKQSKDWKGQTYLQPLILHSEISLFWRTSCARNFFFSKLLIVAIFVLVPLGKSPKREKAGGYPGRARRLVAPSVSQSTATVFEASGRHLRRASNRRRRHELREKSELFLKFSCTGLRPSLQPTPPPGPDSHPGRKVRIRRLKLLFNQIRHRRVFYPYYDFFLSLIDIKKKIPLPPAPPRSHKRKLTTAGYITNHAKRGGWRENKIWYSVRITNFREKFFLPRASLFFHFVVQFGRKLCMQWRKPKKNRGGGVQTPPLEFLF